MDIIFEKIKETGIVKLNRPKALNALNYDMSEKFSHQLNEWENNNNITRVLLKNIIQEKNSRLCFSADIEDPDKLLHVLNTIGHYISVCKHNR